jgi:CubicO group peptidase (beta-lactamase class C family)
MFRPAIAFAGGVMLVSLVACGSAPPAAPKLPTADSGDPEGPHRDAVAAQVKPFLDGELVSGLVVGLYNAGKVEIYGFGTGPGGKPPDGQTLFDLGTATRIYTGLLLADAVQRKEVDLDAPIADLMPPGIAVPTRDKVPITAKHLALHSSGLPRHPGSLLARKPPPDPFAGYTEDRLYQDLVTTQLASAPGTEISISEYGTGLLGFALGLKIGGGYASALKARVLDPLALKDTFVTLPTGASARKALGTDDDLKQTSRWTWGALAGAGALIASARDMIKLVDAQLDAAAGSRGPLRPQLRLAQEAQLDRTGDNESFSWMIDGAGRLWHDGKTAGFRTYVGLDPKTKRGVVVLASTSTSLIDLVLGPLMFDVMAGTAKEPTLAPSTQMLARYAGKYDFSSASPDTVLDVVAVGKRLYLEGPGEPRHRMAQYGDRGFWIEDLQSAAKFIVEGDLVKSLVFQVAGRTLVAPRVEAKP